MKIVWSLIAAAVVGLATAATLHFVSTREPSVVHGYGVLSQCGFYGVIVVYSDGTHVLFNAANPVPREIEILLNSNPEMRTAIIVPCPSAPRPMPQILKV